MTTPPQGPPKKPALKNRRKLTPFLCQEMLYDYATERLDNERRVAVEEFLKTDKECQDILDGIVRAMAYTARLAATEPSAEIVEHLKESENFVSIGRRYTSWKEWPDVMRWAIVCILLVVFTAGLVTAVPWKKLSLLSAKNKSDAIEIATLNGPNASQVFANQETTEAEAAAASEGSGDEESEVASDGAEVDTGEAGDDGGSSGGGPAVVAAPAIKKPDPKIVAQQPTATPVVLAPLDETLPLGSGHKDPKIKGFVYRAFMTLQNLEELGPKITSEIEQLGGEKAGEVELGWKRGTGRYYHFAVPEANEEKLLERLRAYGPVRLSKDPHPRVMPPGQVRFILWVESNGN